MYEHSKKRKNKKKQTNYCHICCKYFSSATYHKTHMLKYHDEVNSNQLSCKSNIIFSTQLKPTCTTFWINNSIMDEFQTGLTSKTDTQDDQFVCHLCNNNFFNSTAFMEHEKVHYQIPSVTNNNDIPQEAYEKNVLVSIILDNFGGITCISCQRTFTSISGFEEHKIKGCKNVKRKNLKSLLRCKQNVQTEVGQPLTINEARDEVNIELEENALETHIKVLKQIKLVPQKFDCIICKSICERLDHLEVHKWWWESEEPVEFRMYECYVCNEQFTEEKEFKTHESDHILKNIC